MLEAKGESSIQYSKANKKVNKKKKNPPNKTNGKNKKKQQIKHHEKDTLTLEISRLFTHKSSRSFMRKQNLSSKRSG